MTDDERYVDFEFVKREDGKLIDSGTPLHARPFHVIRAWMKQNGIIGNPFDNALVGSTMDTYKKLYPSGDFRTPPIFEGGVQLDDQWYSVRCPIIYGKASINPVDLMEIPRSTLEHAWERSPEQGWRAYYCVADIVDFGYSADDLRGSDQTAVTLWKKASTSLTATTRTLGGGHNIDAAIQSACLAAETAIKGTLAHLGVPENRRKQLGHSLSDLADELIRKAPRADAQRLKDACNHFPGYVSTRYDPHGLSRIDILHLGMRAEYVSAEALRCVSQRDLARTLENDPANSQRPRV